MIHDMDPVERVTRYHQETAHDFHRYARSLGYMDWANQPDPFRRYEGAPLVMLPRLTAEDAPVSPSYALLYAPTAIPPQPVTLNGLSRFFEYSLSITAWKAYGGTRWALRSNPSSGNLHPTEGYLLISNVAELPLEPGLYHYAPKEHGLELRMRGSSSCLAALLQDFPPQSFLVGLSSIHWREAWKYGERAFRYCQHDVGHAIGSLRVAGAALGWSVFVLTGLDDGTVGSLLGLSRLHEFAHAESERPALMCAVCPASPRKSLPLSLDPAAVESCGRGAWQGQANRLSRDHPIPWELIDEVTRASWKHSTERSTIRMFPLPVSPRSQRDHRHQSTDDTRARNPAVLSAHQIIHQRRSAVAFDGTTSISARQLFSMLERVWPHARLPVAQRPMPWDSISWDPTIHLAVFLHRVDGLPSGLYMLLRHADPTIKETFQRAMHEQFVWTVPENCPPSLPLYLLEEGNVQRIAVQLSCHQEIAGAGAFSLGMVAEFEASLEKHGPWFYTRLFWETGLIGHVLYLEAEAAGVRATGIGCFFDGPVHRVLGWHPHTQFQSLYHFTVGGPVEDHRLTTLPPYGPAPP